MSTQRAENRPQRRRVIGVLLHDFQLGGAERVAIRLANAWSRMGHGVMLFTGNAGGPQRALVDAAIEVVTATPPIARSASSALRLARWLVAHDAVRGIDLFYLPGNSCFRAVDVLADTGKPVFVTITNSLWRGDRSLPRNLLFAVLTRWRLRRAAGVISMSPALLQQERRVLGPVPVMQALPNALFDNPWPAHAGTRRPWHVCAVGRLVPQKNFTLLLHSLALLQDLPVTLSIAGDGSQRQQLQQLAVTLGIAARVSFLGAVSDVAACLREAEAMLLTSDYEGYPAVAVEALAAGTFLVTSDCSVAMADIVQSPEQGVIVTGRNPADFAAALRNFFTGTARSAGERRIELARGLMESHVAGAAARRYLDFMGVAADVAPHQAARSPIDTGWAAPR